MGGKRNRFQLNFRNHRKIVVIDGKSAFVGGHNIGDEYLLKTRKYGHWRDTHVYVEGPAVPGVQLTFISDWFWASRKVLDLPISAVRSAVSYTHLEPTRPLYISYAVFCLKKKKKQTQLNIRSRCMSQNKQALR
eukprot:TRINITY_DN38496_c0_g1_i1.p1 TRINITY_DN38496_c0_g1~~TRINITY_DN38496_c0_g1_i1.p1  ORF type:complete len:134 (+),score=19.70 TRINITY_DN38496_c0_g1_i1:147-548(+)